MTWRRLRRGCALAVFASVAACGVGSAQTLDDELKRVPPAALAAEAKRDGDAARGAVVFFQQQSSCSKCHTVGGAAPSPLGPDLAALGPQVRDEELVESVLHPSKAIRKGYEPVSVTTLDGKTLAGLLVERTKEKVVLRDVARGGEAVVVPADQVEAVEAGTLSIMPPGQANQLGGRQAFLDLLRYLMEVRDGGAARARALQPAAALLTLKLPEYEEHLDHAGLIRRWDAAALRRGEAIYQRVCANCHGSLDRVGSLPHSLRFGEGKFKNGADPHAMYRTLTRGFGQMTPQTWMVPSQKYDVVHYIREVYLRPHNPSQYTTIDAAYLAGLPKGDGFGPPPSKIEPWSAADYGPSFAHTIEAPGRTHNIAYKGVAVRLDPGPGGVSRGRRWMLFEMDTLRYAAAWSKVGDDAGFLDWRGIQLNGEHQVHPRLVGRVAYANSTDPGWADPATGSFQDSARVLGRDGRRYGPLPRSWGRFRGLHHHGDEVAFSYTIGSTEVLESPRSIVLDGADLGPAFLRVLNLGPRERELTVQIAEHASPAAVAAPLSQGSGNIVKFAPGDVGGPKADGRIEFDGKTFLEAADGAAFETTSQDFTIAAKLATRRGGTIFALVEPGPKWAPGGRAFFVRDGRLAFDVGWVGVVAGKTKIDDGEPHAVAATWQASERRARLYVDGRLDGEGTLAVKGDPRGKVARIGFAAPDFPQPDSYFQGELFDVRFLARRTPAGAAELVEAAPNEAGLVGRWRPAAAAGATVADLSGGKRDAVVRRGAQAATSEPRVLLAGVHSDGAAVAWTVEEGKLRLKIPAGKQPLELAVWTAAAERGDASSEQLASAAEAAHGAVGKVGRDLRPLTAGGPPRWPQTLATRAAVGADDGPFAVDVLTAPEANPWLVQTRFTGLDFFPDGRIAACTWDGDVWIVEGPPNSVELRWRRIASGLYQPLGLKILDGRIHLICRDQLAVLHDKNGDGEIDYYECLNSDHQVTEHFHEFAMGLQTDAAGNFYYAKSGRHGLPAVVPHHGTLLRVTADGARTDVLANGFRAANGVCLNPDGSFVVTDQEGFWNPKNRINWVTLDPSGKPKFYGNLFGWTDVVDPSDAAMEPPLCWITNAFDRSPAELLWVDSPKWGALNGALLNLSYGYGKVFLVPHERVDGRMQGGMIELPLPPFPTGVMRGRFHPGDGQLYLCGMFAWAGAATHPGGLYRLRATGKPPRLPLSLVAKKGRLELTFSEPLDPAGVDAAKVQIKTWSLKRTAGYGSKHYDEAPLAVRKATLSSDGRTLTLDLPELRPVWCMEIRYELRAADGGPVAGTIHNTIHALGD